MITFYNKVFTLCIYINILNVFINIYKKIDYLTMPKHASLSASIDKTRA